MGNPWAYDFTAVGGRTSPLLIILGSDGEAAAKPQGGGYRVSGNGDVYKLLPEAFAFDQLNLSKQFLRDQGRPDPARYDCVLNLVTDPDQHPRTLETMRKLLRGFKGRVINRPEAVQRSTRDQVAKRLAGIEGLRVPRVLRLHNPKPGAAAAAAERAGLAFPLIVRRAGTHTGDIIGLVDNSKALDAACGERGDFILTEFVDFRSEDGLYRKYRAFFIGGRRLLRHMIGAEDWKINARERFSFMAKHPALVAEEQRILEDPAGVFPPQVTAALNKVCKRIDLDFFGLDFGIARDGNAVLFEANATMNFFPVMNDPPFAHIECVIRPARAALSELLGLGGPPGSARAPCAAR